MNRHVATPFSQRLFPPQHKVSGVIYSSYFKLPVRWLSSLTPVTYWSKFLGIRCVAAFMQLELFRV
ncbi:hypothetical protein DS259_15865 [Salmonella enterica subsp. indica]|nr:hypothetical protein [Salmonella enterica subsp. indica]